MDYEAVGVPVDKRGVLSKLRQIVVQSPIQFNHLPITRFLTF